MRLLIKKIPMMVMNRYTVFMWPLVKKHPPLQPLWQNWKPMVPCNIPLLWQPVHRMRRRFNILHLILVAPWVNISETMVSMHSLSMMIYQNTLWLTVKCHWCFVVHQDVKHSQEMCSTFTVGYWKEHLNLQMIWVVDP